MTQKQLYNLVEELTGLPVENNWMEFKHNKGSITNEQIGEYISAMSNGATIAGKNFGYIIWGIDDITHEIVGTNFNFNTAKHGNQDLELWLRNLLQPRINFEIFEFEYKMKKVVMLRIPAAKGEPTYFKSKAYIRINSNKTELKNFPDYLRIIYNSQEDWSAKIIEDANISDLSQEAIDKAKELFKVKNPTLSNEVDSWSDITFLNKAKLTIKDKITNTAILLLGKPESELFLFPATAKITWILKDKDNIEKDYEHFTCPLLLNTQKVYKKIRNLKYRYMPLGTLFPEEVEQYDPYIIREALNNCIAHQDYSFGGKIIVVESEKEQLIFVNAGKFIPNSVEEVVFSDSPEYRYRNKFLTDAMVNLNMIDSIGSGIKKMFIIQKNRFFPLPEYDLSNDKVTVTIFGKILNINYAQKLAQHPDLSLHDIIALDKVAKGKVINENEIKSLKKKKLIEGRKPNFFVSSSIAEITNEKATYIKNKAFDKNYYKDLIISYLKKYKFASREDIDSLLIEKLSNTLTLQQKRTKIRNLLYEMSKKDKTIFNNSKATNKPKWKLINNQNKIEKR